MGVTFNMARTIKTVGVCLQGDAYGQALAVSRKRGDSGWCYRWQHCLGVERNVTTWDGDAYLTGVWHGMTAPTPQVLAFDCSA